MGGLGNQMFQYAAGKALAVKYNTELKLDHTFLEDRTPKKDFTYRNYELNAFGIDNKIQQKDMDKLGLSFKIKTHEKILSTIIHIAHGYKKICQNSLQFEPTILSQGPNSFLIGYFQNERYFLSCEKIIRNVFSFIPPVSDENKVLIQYIQRLENPIAIHVRRGDYLTIGDGKVHYICSPEYYAQAVKIIREKTKNPTFLVFSADDPQWAKENLDIGAPFQVIGDKNVGAFGYENMRLISMCKHAIIANSSFSWWGAWLNKNPNKIVIAPKQWWANGSKQSLDIQPNSWITL
jgi:hypothetical protein